MKPKTAAMVEASPTYDVSALSNTPRQRRSQELTLRVLQTAEEIIRDVGHDGLTIALVAERANVSIGGLYGRFKSRDEIIHAVHGQLLRNLERVSNTWSKDVGKTYDETLRRFVIHILIFFQEHGSLIPRYGTELPRTAQLKVADTETMLCGSLATALDHHRDELGRVDIKQVARIIIHIVLASAVRESATDRNDTARLITWPLLLTEIPEVVVGYARMRIE